MSHHLSPSLEKRFIAILLAIQFANALDFMIIMPLGPDLAKDVGISLQDMGLISGAYAFAAALSSLLLAPFLDRFPRKKLLTLALMGQAFSTFLCVFAWNTETLILARLCAGFCGGPLASLIVAMIADHIPPERRGRAMGKVMGGFALASVMGIPLALELSRLFSWHAPFVGTTFFIGLMTLIAYLYLPLAPAADPSSFKYFERFKNLFKVLKNKIVIYNYLAIGLALFSAFMIIPNISSYIQMNLEYPREKLGILYVIGGASSLIFMRVSGHLIDRFSSTLSVIIFSGCLMLVLLFWFVVYKPFIPVVLLFAFFMTAMSGRSVSIQTLASKVPEPKIRGAFTSLQGVMAQLAIAGGSGFSTFILVEKDNYLYHISELALFAIALSLFVPYLVYKTESKLKKKAKHNEALEAELAIRSP
jgi:predicted MFS family arabinose efflux permease